MILDEEFGFVFGKSLSVRLGMNAIASPRLAKAAPPRPVTEVTLICNRPDMRPNSFTLRWAEPIGCRELHNADFVSDMGSHQKLFAIEANREWRFSYPRSGHIFAVGGWIVDEIGYCVCAGSDALCAVFSQGKIQRNALG